MGAADFAWEFVSGRLLPTVVPAEIVVTVGEVNVFLVEDGGPLERSTYK